MRVGPLFDVFGISVPRFSMMSEQVVRPVASTMELGLELLLSPPSIRINMYHRVVGIIVPRADQKVMVD